ncbi:MAG: LysR family transcriptional regulator [Ponticaulis sp.]|nr:LysR family transcriptional regulator [Ponticaulis sp.]|tara:strand:+ start:12191 stop:13093 length:903 start_codon:yes stop_codon:yes gene_type:complete
MILPSLRQLQFLDALAREGSFSRAAESMHVTQPTLSTAIRELEGILDVQLVEREARGATLTATGQEVVNRARALLSDAEDLVLAAKGASEPLFGTFRLGAIPTIAPFVLPRVLKHLKSNYPNLTLYLREEQTARLLDDLRARRLDAALIALPYEAVGIETVSVFEDEFLLAAPKGHPLGKEGRLKPEDLAPHDVLLLEDGHCLRDHALSVCKMPSVRDGGEVSATSLHTLIQMVDGGLGVSLIPRIAADSGLGNGLEVSIRPFSPPAIGRSIGVAWRSGSSREEDARIVAAELKTLFAKN